MAQVILFLGLMDRDTMGVTSEGHQTKEILEDG
jgi:hypothetical protein